MKTPPTPPPDDLDCAANWVEACQGEDRERLEKVAAWLRAKAAADWERLERKAAKGPANMGYAQH